MSKIVEKTVNSLQAYVSRNILRGEFLLQDFTLDIASAASKEDENEIIARKLSALEQDMKDYSKTDRIEEYLLQAMYLEMLGHPTPFAYVHAVKLLQQGQLNQKLIGYLATTVFLYPSHELVVLLINSIQRDLASKVSLVVVMALEIIPKLIHGEFALAVEPLVIEKTKHYSSAVRKAALVALQHCYSQCGSTQIPLAPVRVLEKGLADTEINVVSSAAQCIRTCAKDNGGEIGHLCSPLLDVLSQLRLKRAHSDYEFGGISAPWLQLSILSALGHLQLNKEQTENVLSTLKEILDSRIVNQTIYYGILWESLNTLSKVLTAGSPLQKSAVDCIAKMLHSNSTDLNYSGVDALERILAKCCPSEAVTCQDVIIDCLHHPDESVRIKTLNLLITMANATNVAAIVQRVLKYASTVGDYSVRSFVCEKVIHLLKLYPFCDVRWCATTFVNLLLIAPSHITEATVLHFINIFKKEKGAVLPCIIPELLKADTIYCGKSASLMILLAWGIGEVKPDMPGGCSFLESVQKLLVILEACQHDSHLCLRILTSLSKLLLNWKCPLQDDMGTLTRLANNDTSPLVKQRSQELLRWNKLLQQKDSTLENGDYEKENFKVDTTLSFLDGYVCKALEADAMPYKPRVFTAVTLEDVRTASAAVFNLDIAGATCCSESDMDVLSPDYHSFTSDVPFSESSEKASPWSATGRRKSESKDHIDTRLEGKNVDSSKQEDVELLKTLFSPISSTNAAKAASVVSPDFSSENVDVASSSGLQQQSSAVSKSAELWGIELKRHS
ncbi:AP-4 complex subunit epsilon-1-like [Dermacentor albipictus]|uniref:AP-4 complex subunit epsilon-1-like n=1 Tax=Dermacentor albipictus TaxID=60249 RepID=UPI0038FCC6B9